MEKEIRAIIAEEEDINGVICLESLKGPQGLSAYEIYVSNLPDGEIVLSEQEWINSLSKTNFYGWYENSYTIQDDQTVLPIGINAYTKTCILEFFVEGFRYKHGADYVINDDYKSITIVTPLKKGTIVSFFCLKTMVATQKDYEFLKGEKGDDGIGIPNGGEKGQVLVKQSESDYDVEWRNITDASIKIKRWEGVQ